MSAARVVYLVSRLLGFPAAARVRLRKEGRKLGHLLGTCVLYLVSW